MGKQRLLTIYQVVGFLGVLSIAASYNSFSINDYGNTHTNDVKEKCSDYPQLCVYWKETEEEGDKVLKNQDNCTKDNGKPEILFEVPFLSPERFLEKRFAVYRRRNPYAQGYKRGPGFRSWGGKRSEANVGLEKRTKFASWGGKRDGSWEIGTEDKRTKFGNWGGKREDYETQDKRTKFRSWGGKRTRDHPEEPTKRDLETPISYDQMDKRDWKDYRTLYLSEPFKKHVPKRPQFQSWGGKRTLQIWSDGSGIYHPGRFYLKNLPNWEEKRKFSSWGGKRNENNPDLGKRFEQNANDGKIPNEFKTRQIFQNWGGKRDGQEEEEEDGDREDIFGEKREPEDGVSDNERKKRQNPKTPENFPNFNSWGGKRGDDGQGMKR